MGICEVLYIMVLTGSTYTVSLDCVEQVFTDILCCQLARYCVIFSGVFFIYSQANDDVVSVFGLYSDVVADIRHDFIVNTCRWFFFSYFFICTILYVILPTGVLNCSYWHERYCTALHQPASAKLCSVIQGIELRNFRRGRHLYSAGRPSHWASAHILVHCIL